MDGRTEWTDGMDGRNGRTDDTKTISLRLRRGIISSYTERKLSIKLVFFFRKVLKFDLFHSTVTLKIRARSAKPKQAFSMHQMLCPCKFASNPPTVLHEIPFTQKCYTNADTPKSVLSPPPPHTLLNKGRWGALGGGGGGGGNNAF